MRTCSRLIVLAVLSLASAASSASWQPADDAVPTPKPAPAPPAKRSALPQNEERFPLAGVQVRLARSGFSPGLIDGKPGRKTKLAIEHFQRGHALDVTGVADDPTLVALASSSGVSSGDAWTRPYTLTESDFSWITGPIPEDWNERAALPRSGYADIVELLAERGWCTTDLVRTLNPSVAFDQLAPGDEVNLPDVKPPGPVKLDHLEVDLNEKLVVGFDADGIELLLIHCSIARQVEKRPVGELHVKVFAVNPEYTFDPKDWPEIDNVSTKLRIAPGPRNPVGLAWVGLDKPGYGMHGTPRPQDIGKTGSHGCFRLANWDAVRLAKLVRVGMVVNIHDSSSEATR